MKQAPSPPEDEAPSSLRSFIMRSVRAQNTTPEKIVRRAIHALGLRFRLHRKDLPGTPDIVLPGQRKVVFVHGCFWHRHKGCRRATTPRTRFEYWQTKFARNQQRDAKARTALRRLGWSVLTVWECETRHPEALRRRLVRFLETESLDSQRN